MMKAQWNKKPHHQCIDEWSNRTYQDDLGQGNEPLGEICPEERNDESCNGGPYNAHHGHKLLTGEEGKRYGKLFVVILVCCEGTDETGDDAAKDIEP